MSWKSARRAASLALAAGAGLALAGCGGAPAKDAKARPAGALIDRKLDPVELFPADLDLVARIDVARMRAAIGPSAAKALSSRAFGDAGDDVIRGALACADVVWVAARAGEVDVGDHVIVVEGRDCAPDLAPGAWTRGRSTNAQVGIFDRRGAAARRGTARVVTLGPRLTAFVSPVEVDAVSRVLRDGPDAQRGNPVSEGVISLDLRAARLPPGLERKYPSIAAIVAGLERVRGTAVVVDEGVQVDAQIVGSTAKGAEKALHFLEALRDNVADPKYAALMRAVKIEQVATAVRVRVVLPGKVVLALLGGAGESPPRQETTPAP